MRGARTPFGQFRVDAVLAQVPGATLHRAFDPARHEAVAVWVLDEGRSTPVASEQLRRRVRQLASLSHPGFGPILEVGRLDDRLFAVGALPPSTTLAARLVEAPDLDSTTALAIIRRLADLIEYLHSQNVIYGRLIPERVYLDVRGEPWLSLLDLLMVVLSDTAQRGPTYTAPEVRRGLRATRAADIYALGGVAYDLLAAASGSTPAANKDDAHDFMKLSLVRGVLARALADDPQARYERASEFVADLSHALGQLGLLKNVQPSEEPELTPFSLEDLGLSPEEIAQLEAAEIGDQPAAPISDEPELTPFSLADLGLSEDEIAQLEAANESDEQEATAPGRLTADEPELIPFSLADLGLSPDEIAQLESANQTDLFFPATGETIASGWSRGEEPELAPFSFDDFDLGEGTATSDPDRIDDSFGGEVQPFSFDDLGLGDLESPAPVDPSRELGLTAEELAGLDLGDFEKLIGDPSITTPLMSEYSEAALERLMSLGQRQGFVDLSDIIVAVSDPEAQADQIEEMGWSLHRAGIQIRDGDEIIDMEAEGNEPTPNATQEPALAAPVSEDEPDLPSWLISDPLPSKPSPSGTDPGLPSWLRGVADEPPTPIQALPGQDTIPGGEPSESHRFLSGHELPSWLRVPEPEIPSEPLEGQQLDWLRRLGGPESEEELVAPAMTPPSDLDILQLLLATSVPERPKLDERSRIRYQINFEARRLEAAMPRTCEVGRATEVRSMIPLANSEGLRRFLPDTTKSGDLITKDRVDGRDVRVPMANKAAWVDLYLVLESLDFTIPKPEQRMRLRPGVDSHVATFLLIPLHQRLHGRVVVCLFEDERHQIQLDSLTLVSEIREPELTREVGLHQLSFVAQNVLESVQTPLSGSAGIHHHWTIVHGGLLNFSGSQMGDVSFRDIAGGDIAGNKDPEPL
jgi:serine/threonine protein kinase